MQFPLWYIYALEEVSTGWTTRNGTESMVYWAVTVGNTEFLNKPPKGPSNVMICQIIAFFISCCSSVSTWVISCHLLLVKKERAYHQSCWWSADVWELVGTWKGFPSLQDQIWSAQLTVLSVQLSGMLEPCFSDKAVVIASTRARVGGGGILIGSVSKLFSHLYLPSDDHVNELWPPEQLHQWF